MIIEMAEKIVVIPPQWRVGRIQDMTLFVEIEGHTQAAIPLARFTDGALRQIKAILLGKVHALVMNRANVWEDVAMVNEELSNRVNNEAACRNNPPLIPSQEAACRNNPPLIPHSTLLTTGRSTLLTTGPQEGNV